MTAQLPIERSRRVHGVCFMPVGLAVLFSLIMFGMQHLVVGVTGPNVWIAKNKVVFQSVEPLKVDRDPFFFAQIADRGPKVSAHLFWGLSCLALVLILASGFYVAGRIVWRSWADGDANGRRTILCVFFSIVVAGLIMLAVQAVGGGPGAFSEIPKSVVEMMTTEGTRLNVVGVTTALAIAAVIAVGALLLASSTTLLPIRPDGLPPMEQLAGAIRRLQRLFYIGAAACVAGVFEVFALFRWPVAFVEDYIEGMESIKLARGAIINLAMTYSFAAGTLFTLILVALYMPAALKLRLRAHDLAIQEFRKAKGGQKPAIATARDVERLLKRHGLHLTWAQLSNQIMAAAGPFLAGGPIAAMINNLMS